MSWINRRMGRSLRSALQALRSKVLSDGAPFFRVISDSFDHRDFAAVEGLCDD